MTWTTDVRQANQLQWDGRTPCHTEAFDLAVLDPKGDGGWWLRYTLDAPLEGEPYSTLWGAHFSKATPDQRFALRSRFPDRSFAHQSDGFHIRVSKAELSRRMAKGGLRNPKQEDQVLRWNLQFADPADPLQVYTKRRMYRRSWPPLRLLTPMPVARCRGVIEAAGKRYDLQDALAHQSHWWGTRHFDRWAWGLVTRFRERPNGYVCGLSALPRVGARSFTALHLDDGEGTDLAFDRFSSKRGSPEDEGQRPGVWTFEAKKGRYSLSGRISASLQKMVGMTQQDPEGTERYLHHSCVADATLELWRRSFGRSKLEQTLTAKGTAMLQQGAQRPFEDVEFYL